MFIKKRSANKKQNPNKYAICAGHVVGDETIEEALTKEAKEELGIDLNSFQCKPLITVKRTAKKSLFLISFLYFSRHTFRRIQNSGGRT